MHPKVRDLYKRFIVAGQTYPQGLNYVRSKAKTAFFKNSHLHSDDIEFKKAIGKGRYWTRELIAISKLHKYRAMKNRYYNESSA